MQGHILEEWRIRDIEQKADRATNRLYELDALRSDVNSFEHTVWELGASVDELRSALKSALGRISVLEDFPPLETWRNFN